MLGSQDRRRRRPGLDAYFQSQGSAAGSLYEFNPSVTNVTNYSVTEESNNTLSQVQPFSFACELAHGSNQVRISGFANIPDLYQRIAESFNIPVSQLNKEQERVLKKLADAVEEFLGIADEELAQSIFDIQCKSRNKDDFLKKLGSNFCQFNFPTYVANNLWTAFVYYTEAKQDFREY